MGQNVIIQPSDLTTGRLTIALDKEIKKLNIDKTPLMKLLDQVGKESVDQMKYLHLQKERREDWSDIAAYGGAWAAGANAGGTVTVGAGEGWKWGEGDVFKNPSNSDVNLYVVSVSGDVLTCTTFDNTTTVDFSAGSTGTDKLLLIENTFGLGSNRGTMKSQQPAESFNYINILQHPYGVVQTLLHTGYDAGKGELQEQEEETLIEHEFAKERAFFFSQKHLAATGYMTSGGNLAQYFTGGLLEAITTNVITEADLTRAEFGSWVNQSIYYAKRPVIFAGELIFEALSWWLGQNLKTKQDETTLGIAVSTYENQYGVSVNVIPHRELLTGFYTGYAFAVDLDDVRYKYLNGQDTHLEVGIQPPGQKQMINEYRSWFGCWIGNQKNHGLLKGVTTISA